ncbi:hypothetical protein ACFL2S_03875 [Thermodesulfobacteriota bacterium]
MLTKISFSVLGLSLVLFSGCVSQNKYMGLETELKSAQTQMDEDEIAFKNLQIQNEKLLNENISLSEEIEDLKLELKKENLAVAPTESNNSKQDNITNEMNSPYFILLSSCRLKESVQVVLSKYRKMDIEPYVVKVDLGENGIWWRIGAGHYKTREIANIEKSKYSLTDNIVLKIFNGNHMDGDTIENEADNKASLIVKKTY